MPQRGVAFSATYEAVDRSTGAYVTGDVANHTILFALDGIETSPANAPIELSRGEYAITLTAGEMTAASITVYGASSTSNVLIIPTRLSTDLPVIPESTPPNAQSVVLGGTFSFPFFTRNSQQALVDADSTPTLTVYRNYTSTMLTATLGHQGTGQYNSSLVLGSPWVDGDTGYVLVAATVSGLPLDQSFFFEVETTDAPGYSGTAQDGSPATITLASSASSQDNIYVGQLIVTNLGLLSQEVRTIIAYVGSTKVATVGSAWTNSPTNSTQYAMPGINPVNQVTVNATSVNVIVTPS